ncbi:M23 family metallopeptidase [soil metagenome]
MVPFVQDLLAGSPERSVIVFDDDPMAEPSQYRIQPRVMFTTLVGASLLVGCAFMLLFAIGPGRAIIFGPEPADLEAEAIRNATRLAALEDSLEVQNQYVAQLRGLILGEADTSTVPISPSTSRMEPLPTAPGEFVTDLSSDRFQHEQPAIAFPWLQDATSTQGPAVESYLASLRLPTLAPVAGLPSRGFDPAAGHYGMDIAVQEGTPVRSFGDGYVVLADWTQDGGFSIVVQHADGYLSVYKHNSRLLKRVGDRVRGREAIALSGNTGEITTGPHVHFELWRHGLAQDPRLYFYNA